MANVSTNADARASSAREEDNASRDESEDGRGRRTTATPSVASLGGGGGGGGGSGAASIYDIYDECPRGPTEGISTQDENMGTALLGGREANVRVRRLALPQCAKKVAAAAAALLILIAVIGAVLCVVDPCECPEPVECADHSRCTAGTFRVADAGTCACTDGYSGANCETPPDLCEYPKPVECADHSRCTAGTFRVADAG
eukprot:SAG11_NODE_3525_length_2394_cov_1.450545_1_plen_200_part_10